MIYTPAEDSFLLQRNLKHYVTNKSVLDMGSGSGIQAEEAIKNQASSVIASDISIEVIKYLKNKFKHNKNVNIIKSNLFQNIRGKFEVILFNPPYLPQDSREDKESQQVTTGGRKGDEIIIKFLKQSKSHLNTGGKVLLIISSLTPHSLFLKTLKNLNFKSRMIDQTKVFMETLELWEIKF